MKVKHKLTDLEKDIRNPLRRFIRHTIQKDKYGDMLHYRCDVVHYYASQSLIDIEEAEAKALKDWDKYFEEAEKKADPTQNEVIEEAQQSEKIKGFEKSEDGLYHPVIFRQVTEG